LRLTAGQIRDPFPNPPPNTLLVFPLAWLDLATARIIWTAFNLILLLGALVLLTEITRLTPFVAVLLGALSLVAAPVVENMRHAQAYIFLLFLYSLALWGLTRGRKAWVGSALAISLAVKASGLPLWLLLAVRREWRALFVGILTLGILASASVVISGPDIWLAYTRTVPQLAGAPTLALTAYQTTASFFQHLFHFDREYNPAPLADAPLLAVALTLALSLAALGVTLWASRLTRVWLGFAALTILSVILFPRAEDYHFVLMILPVYVVVGDLLVRGATRWLWGIAMLGCALLWLPLPFEHPALSRGAVALFAYPRLYGSWLLWLVLLVRMIRSSSMRLMTVEPSPIPL
jgi:alpha-1,2-mannosyltransferase